MADDKPIIIIKKSGGHGGHHGGAWKIAFADLVTAMMAFFMVMWLVNSADTATRQSVAAYFRRPGLFSQGSGTPLMMGSSGILADGVPPRNSNEEKGTGRAVAQVAKGTPLPNVIIPTPDPYAELELGPPPQTKEKAKKGAGLGEGKGGTPEEQLEEEFEEELELQPTPEGTPRPTPETPTANPMEAVAQQIRETITASPELMNLLGAVDVKVDADGLNIEIMDIEKSSMFTLGSSDILSEANEAFNKLAEILKKLPNKIDIVGHTDAKPYTANSRSYSNWELSADRANAARKLLERAGIPVERITSVIGKADRELVNKGDPLAASNRRITLKMRFDLNQNVNLGKDPNALNDISKLKPKASPLPGFSAPQTVHRYSPGSLLKAAKATPVPTPLQLITKKKPDRLDTRKGKGQIFSNSPVVGPPDPFAGF